MVYRAHDTTLKRDVAIKVLNARALNDGPARQRFRTEALILSRLNHPNVESVYEFRTEQDIDFLVLEFVPGTTLNELTQNGSLPEQEVIGLGVQLARGLTAAHSQRVIHRDLKPGNLRVTPDNVLKILDFGLAQLVTAPEDETLTELDSSQSPLAGTPAYLSPEQAAGREPDQRSDIYSAGMVLYELAAGSRPFTQHGQLLVDAILHSLPPSPRLKNKEISPELEAVILKCLEKDPKLRYQSARDLLADLEQLWAEREPSGRALAVPHLQRRPASRKRALMVAALLIAAVVLGTLAWRRFGHQQVQQQVMAVLPMDTGGQDEATSALGLGLTETLTAKLVQASDTSAVQIVSPQDLRDQKVKTADDARREFGTDLVLETNIQRSGPMVRINCYLVDSRTHRQIAAKTIESDISDPFGLQDKVVSAALDMLPRKLEPKEREKLVAVQNTRPAAYEAYVRGQGYLQEYEKPENIENAIEEFNTAIKIDPNYALGYAGLGNAYFTEFERLDKGNEVAAKASQNCQKALSLSPDLVEAHICLGNILNGTGKYDKAVAEFKQALATTPESDDALRGLATAYENLGNNSAAESAYREAITLRPNYWGAYHWMGLFYFGQARYADALSMFKKETEIAPDNYQSYTTLGGTYIAIGNYQDAIDAFHRSIDLRPSPDAYSNLAYTYYLMHRFPDSINAQEEALKLDVGNWEVWGNLGDELYWSPSRRAEAEDKYKHAVELATSKIQLNPNDSRTMIYLAGYLAMLGQKQEGLQYTEKALKESPSDSEVLFRAAIVYNHFGDTEKTLSYLKKSVELGYSRPIIRDTPEFQKLHGNADFNSITS